MKRVGILLLAALLLTGSLAGCAGGGSAYGDLSILEDVRLGEEEFYGIAFRTGSDMVAKVDAITAELYADGTIQTLAEPYGLTDNLVASFAPSTDSAPAGDSDWAYIQDKGTLVIGITDFDPMDYKDANGEWIGFDADYAKKVCEKLGVTPEFKEIVWGNKEMSLETKAIDCVWNGMTITDAMLTAADVTGAYMVNFQAVVVKDTTKYKSLADLKGKTVVAEGGSAGEAAAMANSDLAEGYKAVDSQADALLQVKSGAAEACVIDYIMANSLLNK